MPQKGPKNARKRSADKKEEYYSKEERDALIRAGYVLPFSSSEDFEELERMIKAEKKRLGKE